MLANGEEMSDNANHAASPAEAAPSALKSTDTSVVKPAIAAAAEALKPAAAKPQAAKPAPAQAATSDAGTGTAGGDAGEHEDATSADASTDGKRKDRLPRWVLERMERQRLQVERDTEARLRREFEQRSQPQQPQERREPTNVAATAERAPTLADFNFDTDAYTAHLVDREFARREQATKQAEAQRLQHEAAEQFKTKIDEFESRVGDGAWSDIEHSPINTDPAFAQLTELFMGSEHDLEIALHLANNLTEARRINALSPLQRAVEVHKLVEQFAGETQGSEPPARVAAPEKLAPLPKKTTNAPPPPPKAQGSGKTVVDLDDPKISTADRIAAWQAKKKRS